MNTPNKLTILRILLVPFFVAFLLIEQVPFHLLFALLIFIAAAVTDAIDGNLARKHNLITNFGKFLDPLADKILVVAALICFIELGWIGSVPVVLIIMREFLVSALRLVAVGDGTVIAASIWGKLKTISQMVSIITILVMYTANELLYNALDFNLSEMVNIPLITNVLIWISAVLTVISGVDYMVKNWKFVNHMK